MTRNGQRGTLIPLKHYAIMNADASDLAAIIAEAAGSTGIDPQIDLDRVRIPAGGGLAWEIPTLDGTEAAKTIEGVIVHHADARAYWREALEESGGNAPPDCASRDGLTGIGDPGGHCASCPFAQFGSDERKRGQACKAIKLLYVLTRETLLPLALALPPSSIRPARQYLIRLASRGVRPHQVVTRIGLAPEKNADGIKFSRATFEVAARLNDTTAKHMAEYAAQLRPALSPANVVPADVQEAA